MRASVRNVLVASVAGALALAGATIGASAAAGDRPVTGTVVVDAGPLPLPPVVAVHVKACPTNADVVACFQAGGFTAATPAGSAGNQATFSYSLTLDSSLDYVVGRAVRLDFEDKASPSNSPRVVALSPSAANVLDLPAGTGTEAPTFQADARYYELSGNVAYSGNADFRPGVGACPASSVLVGNFCQGLAVTFERPDHRYLLRLFPGDYRAAGFTLGNAPFAPLLGITNILSLSAPPTTATEARLALDFDANMAGSTQLIENGAPNGGDGNSDGVLDSAQNNVASLKSTVDDAYVTIVAPAPVTSAVAQPLTALLAAPPAAGFPSGLSSFTVGPVSPGATVPLTIVFENTPPAGTEFWKYLDGAWAAYPTTEATKPVGASGYWRSVSLTDGGPGDYDGRVNGYITDPFAEALPFSVSALAARDTKGTTHLTWTISAGTASVGALPAQSTLVAVCNTGTTTLTTKIDANGDGSFHAVVPTGKKRSSCTATLRVPTTPTPNGTFLTRTVTF